MRLPCVQCRAVFTDEGLLELHVKARHSGRVASDEIPRGRSGGRKGVAAPRPSGYRKHSYPKTGALRSLADSFRPAERPTFETGPIEISDEAPEIRNWFTLVDVRDVVDRYAVGSASESREQSDRHKKGLISGSQLRGKRRDGRFR